MITGELKNKIDGIWDIFWSSGMTNPLTVIEQITYLMFIKILDDNELRKEANAAAFDMEVVDPIFDSEHLRQVQISIIFAMNILMRCLYLCRLQTNGLAVWRN